MMKFCEGQVRINVTPSSLNVSIQSLGVTLPYPDTQEVYAAVLEAYLTAEEQAVLRKFRELKAAQARTQELAKELEGAEERSVLHKFRELKAAQARTQELAKELEALTCSS